MLVTRRHRQGDPYAREGIATDLGVDLDEIAIRRVRVGGAKGVAAGREPERAAERERRHKFRAYTYAQL